MIIKSIFDPVVISTGIISCTTFGLWFRHWSNSKLIRSEKERAYICTLLSSSITSICSIPLVYQLLTNGGNLTEILVYRTWTVLVTVFFMSFLFMDLLIGAFFYRSKIGLLTGWIHHLTYLGVLSWTINRQYTSVFIMMCILELPTFLLALGSVRTYLRHDYLFATTFLLSRILFHAYAIHCAWRIEPFSPVMNALSAFFPLHCFWFYGFIQQQIRLYKKQKEQTKTFNTSTPVKTGSLKKQESNFEDIVKSTEIMTVNNSFTKVNQKKKVYYSNGFRNTPSYYSPSSPVSVH